MRSPESWRADATGSELDHFADFCAEHLIQSEDRWEGKPLELEDRQRRMMGEALARRPLLLQQQPVPPPTATDASETVSPLSELRVKPGAALPFSTGIGYETPMTAWNCPVSVNCWKLVTFPSFSLKTWQYWASTSAPVARYFPL